MKRSISLLFILALIQLVSYAQLKVTNVERLPLDASRVWGSPKFSPGGKTVYFTTFDYQGIWSYSLITKKVKSVVSDPRSGYEFAISPDEKQIAYRRSFREGSHQFEQEVVVKDLATDKSTVLESGTVLSTPVFVGSQIVYSVGSRNVETKNVNAARSVGKSVILGIEDTKIVLVENGKKRLLDPLGGGSYIWPQLSPDGKRIVASDMARGTFVYELKSGSVAKIGKRNAAVWTRDGRWLIYMNDKDDGHNITSSDLFCVSPDGKRVKQLTFTKNDIELYPHCSPTENKIVCSTLDGEILVLTYEEVKR